MNILNVAELHLICAKRGCAGWRQNWSKLHTVPDDNKTDPDYIPSCATSVWWATYLLLYISWKMLCNVNTKQFDSLDTYFATVQYWCLKLKATIPTFNSLLSPPD